MESSLSILHTRLTAYAMVTLGGEIDFSNRERLEEQLFQGLDSTRAALIVDMSEVTFCGSSGLNTFVRVLRRSNIQGKALVLVSIQHRVAHLFEVSRLSHEIPIHSDVESAFRWLEGISEDTARTPDQQHRLLESDQVAAE